MLKRFGSPTVNDLYTVNTFYPGAERRFVIAFAVGLALGASVVSLVGWSGLKGVCISIGCALSVAMAMAPVSGYLILRTLDHTRGSDTPRKVIEWFRYAKVGDRLDLDRL